MPWSKWGKLFTGRDYTDNDTFFLLSLFFLLFLKLIDWDTGVDFFSKSMPFRFDMYSTCTVSRCYYGPVYLRELKVLYSHILFLSTLFHLVTQLYRRNKGESFSSYLSL